MIIYLLAALLIGSGSSLPADEVALYRGGVERKGGRGRTRTAWRSYGSF
ncbi:MAG: hypothetical protein NTZ78_06405 [Candidatus Aureabacteria bacterium]|nr:hypothetical protein [Candidatus Auribacterota bacterium]